MPDLVDIVRDSLSRNSLDRFERRVRHQADFLIDEIERDELDNEAFAIGLELEVYAIDSSGRLARIPDEAFSTCNKELGVHNAEINSTPSPFDAAGLAEQAEAITSGVDRARTALGEAGLELVLDAMWTIPPTEGSHDYLAAVATEGGISIARNMQRSPRYCALDNDVLARRNGTVELDLPGCTTSFPTILPESLTTSIQPHLQIPSAETFPRYYNAAIRTMAPVLALATNSPFLPADLYDGVDDPAALLSATHHELRIPVFEQSINAGDAKVCFPGDIETASDIIRRIVDDATRAPFLREWIEDDEPDGFRDSFWELDHKRGTYWRWVRGIPGGQPVGNGSERSLRIEYRPLPTQPTVRETIGLQWLTAGLIRGIVAADHPLETLDWTASRDSFYGVVERGLDAEIAWVAAGGNRTTDPETIYAELFDLARRGLSAAGAPSDRVTHFLAPLEARWETGLTPSRWKLRSVRRHLADGRPLDEAISEMQRRYIRNSGTGTPIVEWH